MSVSAGKTPPPLWRELTAGVWTAVVEPDTVTLGLIAGSSGCLLVDTGSTPAQGAEIRAGLAALLDVPLVAVVVTHGHADHAGGIAAFDDVQRIGHRSLTTGEPPVRLDRPIALATALDLGDRRVEVLHLGEGHTAGDLVVVTGAAVFAGDLVESATPPWYGPDSFPARWPAAVDGLIGLLGDASVVVPGHGPTMTRREVFTQRSELAAVAYELRRLTEAGTPLERAAEAGQWPYPVEHIAGGLAAGYAQLGASVPLAGRRLPLA